MDGGKTRWTVTVTLNARIPERTVTIPITTTDQDGASSSDYSGIPASVDLATQVTPRWTINFTASSRPALTTMGRA